MKAKYFVLTCLVVLLSKSAVAQGSEFELQLIPSLTNLRGNSFTEEISDPTFHFSAGVGYNYLFRNDFLVKGALVYDSKGADGSEQLVDRNNVPDQTVEYRNDYKYLTLPVQVGRRFGGKVKFDVAIGVYAGFLIRSIFESESVNSDGLITSFKNEHNGHLSEVDFGVAGSASVYLPLGERLSLKLGLQDNLGLSDVSKSNPYITATTKHNSLGLHAGLNLKLYSGEN